MITVGESIEVSRFVAFTLGMTVYFVGAGLTRRLPLLREYNIPEPVTGGLLAALAFWLASLALDRAIVFDLATRDILLVIFFTTIGLNARLSMLASGGRPLAILAVLTVAYIVIQNLVALGGVTALGLPTPSAVLFGSASLIGGHGTVIAWGPVIARDNGVAGALETGIAAATLGLILASFLGGPTARFLIARKGLTPAPENGGQVVGLSYAAEASQGVNYVGFMRTLLAVNLVVIAGYVLHGFLTATGLKVPAFLPCLLMGVVAANLLPVLLPRAAPVTGTPTLALISEFALSVFLAMSLMTMDLSQLASVAGPLFAILSAQAAVALLFVAFVVFPALGSDYRAAVLSAGFVGFGLGATPTAVANMTAVTKRHGPAPTAFIVLPLVSAFLTDIANALAIKLFLTL
jgi:ESS family glutamate:Na+ symporter